MKVYKYGVLSLALIFVIVASFWFTSVRGEDKWTQEFLELVDKKERETLVGLLGVGVIVIANERYDLKPDELQESIVQHLESYHINVFPTDSNQFEQTLGGPILSIKVDHLEANDMGIIPVSVQVSLREYVQLVRNQQKRIFTDTWASPKARRIGIATPSSFRETIEQSIKDCVDAFVLAYLAANAEEIKR
jgi:hypothetical protein